MYLRYWSTVLTAVLAWVLVADVHAQETPPSRVIYATPMPTKPMISAPPVPIHRYFLEQEDTEVLVDPSDSATLLTRFARLYQHQADLLTAQAAGNELLIESLFDVAMGELAALAQYPVLLENPRFKELYRSLVTEYERFYGFPDSLALQQGDIYAIRGEAFVAINDEALPQYGAIEIPETAPLGTSIPLTMNDRVRRSMLFLLTTPDEHMNHWLSRADTYFPMIERIFKEEGVPDELKYLAMIESGLNPSAKSWARAVGMWQFVRSTGRAYDLSSNSWVDERMDPEKATRAAARHLKDLHRMFGDWQLALAGYNYSPGRLRRHLRRVQPGLDHKATYWDVYDRLPRETRNYVPMFIATTIIASNPALFGLGDDVVPGPAYEFDHVPVQGMLTIAEVASMAGTTEETIRALNPELVSHSLPPTQQHYYVRLPLYSYEAFAETYSKLPAAQKRAVSRHRVRRGETLGQIARRYGVSVASLMRRNGLHSSVIQEGSYLVVPVANYNDEPLLAAAQPLRVQHGMHKIRPISLASIQQLDPGELIAEAQRRIDQEAAEKAAAEAAAKALAEAPPVQNASDGDSSEPTLTQIIYHVRRGDTLSQIAQTYRVTISEIRKWNNIRGSFIRAGQRLTIYTRSAATGSE